MKKLFKIFVRNNRSGCSFVLADTKKEAVEMIKKEIEKLCNEEDIYEKEDFIIHDDIREIDLNKADILYEDLGIWTE